MLVQLKCNNCNSKLTPGPDRKTYICDYCGARYVLSGLELSEVIDLYQSLNRYAPPYALTEEQIKQEAQAAAERLQRIEEEEQRERCRLADVEQKAYWIRNKLCRHCGGTFTGGLVKTCTKCNRKKDY